jgi:[protein-PII] uridylyltransferase
MNIDREKIEAHARERLQGDFAPAEPRGRLLHFKRFLKLENDRLRMRHRFLWDVGLTVGHSFRTLAECVEEARRDLHSRTALAEARLVAGDTAIFGALDRALDNTIRRDRKSGEAFIESLRADVAERHARFGGAVCVQEPSVKEGVGGLRDLHAVLWFAQALHGVRGLAELDTTGVLSGGDYRRARRAYDFLLRVRAEAHFATGRKTDALTLDLQPAVAKSLGYEARRGLLASELFMRNYYRRASELHDVFRSVVRRPPAPEPRRLFATLTRRRPARDFEVREGRLRAKSAELLATGQGLLAAFAAAQADVGAWERRSAPCTRPGSSPASSPSSAG